MGLAECAEAVGQVFNVGSTHEVTILELARSVLRLVGAQRNGNSDVANTDDGDKQVVLVPYDQAYETGFEDMQRRVPDITKIKRTIDWEPTIPLEQTLRRIIES